MTEQTKRSLKWAKALKDNAEIVDGKLVVDLSAIKGLDTLEKKYQEGREARNDLMVGVGLTLVDKAPDFFSENEEVDVLKVNVPFGGVDHTLRQHREFKTCDSSGEEQTYNNYLTVESDDTFGGGIAQLRKLHAQLVESDDPVEETEEEVEETSA